MVFGTKILKYWVLGPSGYGFHLGLVTDVMFALGYDMSVFMVAARNIHHPVGYAPATTSKGPWRAAEALRAPRRLALRGASAPGAAERRGLLRCFALVCWVAKGPKFPNMEYLRFLYWES